MELSRRARIAPASALLITALLAPAALAEDPATTFHDLVAEYRCAVVDRLQQIYEAAETANPQNLFLIIYFATRTNVRLRHPDPHALRGGLRLL